MHIALTLDPFVDTDLLYAQQLGVDWIIGDMPAWDADTLAAARNRVEQAGLRLSGLACLPASLVAAAISEQPASGAATTRVCRIISDVGKAGIASVGYRWPCADPGLGICITAGRGSAVSLVHTIRSGESGATSEGREAMWYALQHFLRHVLPVAEASGVRLVYQTDVALAALPVGERILDTVQELDRMLEIAGSMWHGLDLDHGFATAVLGLRADEVIRHFGSRGAIFAARLRHLRLTGDGAEEHFMDEDRLAVLRALQAYQEVGFEGPLCPVAAPGMTDDSDWRHKGYAFNVGYLRGLLQTIGWRASASH